MLLEQEKFSWTEPAGCPSSVPSLAGARDVRGVRAQRAHFVGGHGQLGRAAILKVEGR